MIGSDYFNIQSFSKQVQFIDLSSFARDCDMVPWGGASMKDLVEYVLGEQLDKSDSM